MRGRRLGTLAVVVLPVVLLAALAGVAAAEVKITDVPKSWDDEVRAGSPLGPPDPLDLTGMNK